MLGGGGRGGFKFEGGSATVSLFRHICVPLVQRGRSYFAEALPALYRFRYILYIYSDVLIPAYGMSFYRVSSITKKLSLPRHCILFSYCFQLY